MKITRIFTDDAGETHFETVEEPGVEFRDNAAYTRVIDAHGVAFRETKAMGDQPALGRRHTAPQPDFVMIHLCDNRPEEHPS